MRLFEAEDDALHGRSGLADLVVAWARRGPRELTALADKPQDFVVRSDEGALWECRLAVAAAREEAETQTEAYDKRQGRVHAWLDALSAPSIEQFRARVGALHRVPFRRHPPSALPTMDSYFRTLQPGESDESAAGGAGQLTPPGWRLCFPPVYAHGCVPPQNQSAVDQMACGERKAGRK